MTHPDTVFCHLLIAGIITDKLRTSQMSALPIFLMFPTHTTRPLIISPESMQRKMHNNGKTPIKKKAEDALKMCQSPTQTKLKEEKENNLKKQ